MGGGIFMRLTDKFLSHLHPGLTLEESEGTKTSWQRSPLLWSGHSLRIRRTSNVPIVMLSAREEEIDRVMGLSIGAGGYYHSDT